MISLSGKSMVRPCVIIFASGTASGGGSGFENLVKHSRLPAEAHASASCAGGSSQAGGGDLNADIVAVVSNHREGGVKKNALRFNVPFEYLGPPYSSSEYVSVVEKYDAQWVVLSGWLKPVPTRDRKNRTDGLDSRYTFNIHPGPLPRFGGKGMFGDRVHEAVLDAFKKGEVIESEVTMHFVTNEYDKGPIFFRMPVPIFPDDTVETLKKRVNAAEHMWQPRIINLVVHEIIRWDGEDPNSLLVPSEFGVYL